MSGVETANTEENNQKEIKGVEKGEKNKTTDFEDLDSKLQQDPDTASTKGLEKSLGNQNKKTDKIQEPKPKSTSAKGSKAKTEAKDLSVKRLNETPTVVSNSEISKHQTQKPMSDKGHKSEIECPNTTLKQEPETITTVKSSKSQIQELECERTKISNAQGAKEQIETEESSIKGLISETAIVNTGSDISIQPVEKPIIIADQDKDKNKSPESKCLNNKLEQEAEGEQTKVPEKTMAGQQSDMTQELDSSSTSTEGVIRTERKDLRNKSEVGTANSEVGNQNESVIARDQIKGIEKGEKNKTTDSKHLDSNLQQDPDTVCTKALENASDNQTIKTDTTEEVNSISTSAKGTKTVRKEKASESQIHKLKRARSLGDKEKTEGQDSSIKSLSETVIDSDQKATVVGDGLWR
ncbi:hypothetical protein Q5P01_020100 [Channa striata]|uniref:Uncharacterized protein n=1 Tax=Channa striata TaxID=64152 RepID=A0AA88LWX0_CHASR|nr:hypothetical protein Q5P01_020100 [Channa striata]